jgi:mono/diheme cytochrome c family protein
MKRVMMLVLVTFVLPLQAQKMPAHNPLVLRWFQEESGGENAQRAAPLQIINYVLPLPSSRFLTATQLAGKKLFLQRCSVCHLPPLPVPGFEPYGLLLDGKLIAARGEAVEREQIMKGSLRMPGWQYTLEPADIDNIFAYLKSLEYDSAARKYTSTATVKKRTSAPAKK